jgi:hypothetical protein
MRVSESGGVTRHEGRVHKQTRKFAAFFMIRNAKGFIIRSQSGTRQVFLPRRVPRSADKIGLRRDQGLMFAAARGD